jgi:hypothetical protein
MNTPQPTKPISELLELRLRTWIEATVRRLSANGCRERRQIKTRDHHNAYSGFSN